MTVDPAALGIPQDAMDRLAELQPGTKGHIFTSDLTVNEFLLVKQAGFTPLEILSETKGELMAFVKTIICLANSGKHSGRCIAGEGGAAGRSAGSSSRQRSRRASMFGVVP